jgi:hypothetical protein
MKKEKPTQDEFLVEPESDTGSSGSRNEKSARVRGLLVHLIMSWIPRFEANDFQEGDKDTFGNAVLDLVTEYPKAAVTHLLVMIHYGLGPGSGLVLSLEQNPHGTPGRQW